MNQIYPKLILLLHFGSCRATVTDLESHYLSNATEESRHRDVWPFVANLSKSNALICQWIILTDGESRTIVFNYTQIPYPYILLSSLHYVQLSADVSSCALFIIDYHTLTTSDLMLKLSYLRTKFSRFYFLIFGKDGDGAESVFNLPELRFEPDVVVLTKNLITTRKIFSSSNKQQLISRHIQNLRPSQITFPEQFSNFFGQELLCTTSDFSPFTMYLETPGSSILVPKPSLDVFMLDLISQKLNFKYRLQISKDGQWGSLGPDGKFTGVVGDIAEGRANFTLVLSVTEDRNRMVDFSNTYFIDSLTFVSSLNPPSPEWRKVLMPFQMTVWLSLVAVIVVFCGVFVSLQKRFESTLSPDFVDELLKVVGVCVNQNLTQFPKHFILRIFLSLWLLFSMVTVLYYKTSLTSVLTVPSSPPPLDTLEQLLHSQYQYGMNVNKGAGYELFATSTAELYKKLYHNMQFFGTAESWRRVREENYAYIYFQTNLKHVLASSNASVGQNPIHIAKEVFYPTNYAWAFPKGSPLRRVFNKVIKSWFEGGFHSYWWREMHREPSIKKMLASGHEGSRKQQVVLNMRHLQGAFFSLIIGHFVSLIILSIELVVPFVSRLIRKLQIKRERA